MKRVPEMPRERMPEPAATGSYRALKHQESLENHSLSAESDACTANSSYQNPGSGEFCKSFTPF
jgi:hypothetical protein